MATFIIYDIRWAVTLTLLYSLYRLLLRRETFHRLNRAVLLAILVVSPLLPLIPLHTDEPTAMDSVLTRIEEPLMSLSSDANNADATIANQESENTVSGLWVRYCAYIYIVGVAVALTVYMFRLLTLMRVIRRSQRITHPIVPKDVHLMLDMRIKQPSSWMHWIFIGPIDLKQNAETVLRHELAHVRMKHSWDVVLCDLTCRLLWCLPFAWMLRQDLVDVHEFQADEAVLQGGVKLEDYEHLLVRKAVRTQALPIMNTLRRGAVKKRFAMMHSRRSSRWSRLKLLYLVPALAACLWVSAQAEEYKVYLNGKLWASLKADTFLIDGRPVTREEMDAIDPATIKSINVLHSQKTVAIETEPEVVMEADQMPQFPGGDAAFKQYMAHHLRYPKAAAENGVNGTVKVQYIVEMDGRITHVQAFDSPSEETDAVAYSYGATDKHPTQDEIDEGRRALREAAEELIRGMPPFEPGRQNGKPVRVQLTTSLNYM